MPHRVPLSAITILLMCSFTIALVGCAKEKESLHDEDHFVPEHWPNSLADASDKMAERMARIQGDQESNKAAEELGDLVSWAPEIAADTALSEESWIPIYEASEELSGAFDESGLDIAKHGKKLTHLQDLLRSAQATLTATEEDNPGNSNGEPGE